MFRRSARARLYPGWRPAHGEDLVSPRPKRPWLVSGARSARPTRASRPACRSRAREVAPSPEVALASLGAGRVAVRVPEADQTEALPAMRLPGLGTPPNLRLCGVFCGDRRKGWLRDLRTCGSAVGHPAVSRPTPQLSVLPERDLDEATVKLPGRWGRLPEQKPLLCRRELLNKQERVRLQRGRIQSVARPG